MKQKRQWLKAAAWVLAAVVGVAAAAVFAGLQLAQQKMQRKVEVTVQPVAARTDAQALERGKYLYAVRPSRSCRLNPCAR